MEDKPIQLAYDEPSLGAPSDPIAIERILGKLMLVTAIPTYVPRTFAQSIALNTASGQIYYYTGTLWRSVGGAAAYGGQVDATASAPHLPSGWSASYNSSTKLYTVTHNLDTTNYAVVAGTNSFSLNPCFQTRNANYFTMDFENSTGTPFSTAWDFVLTPIV